MDTISSQSWRPATFNSYLEVGIHAVTILRAAYPRSYDLQRLIALDFLLVHTADVGGPENLHPPTPNYSAELIVRRKLIEQGLLLMMTRDLIQREATPEGFKYMAGENAEIFLSSVSTCYLLGLKERAAWLIDELGDLSENDFKGLMRSFFDKWVEEFQQIEVSLGGRL